VCGPVKEPGVRILEDEDDDEHEDDSSTSEFRLVRASPKRGNGLSIVQ
jgi:hypothetical protein